MKKLLTERLELRLWQPSDVNDLYEYAQDPQVGSNAGWPAHENIETSQRIVDLFIKDADVYAIVLKSENKVIGSLGLHERTPEDESTSNLKQREIGYILNPKYWGQGIMPEAVATVIEYGFEELGLELIWCCHFDFNDKSKSVIHKSGFNYRFTTTKTLPNLNNKEVNQLCYSITKEEYFTAEASVSRRR